MSEFHPPEIGPEKTPPASTPGGSTLDGVTKRFRFRSLAWIQRPGFNGGPSRRKGRQLTLWSWLASFIDTLLLIGLSCLFVVVFARVVQAPTLTIFRVIQTDNIWSLLSVILVVGSWFYMVLLRSFFNCSVGEWVCDLRLGEPAESEKPSYILRVILRATLILATGLVAFPVLSGLTGEDIAGKITGLKLFSMK